MPLFVLSAAANGANLPGPPFVQKAIGAEAEGTSCGSAIQTNVECCDFCMGLVYVTYPENIFQGGSGDRPGRDLRGVRGRKRVEHLFDAALTRGGVSLQEKADDDVVLTEAISFLQEKADSHYRSSRRRRAGSVPSGDTCNSQRARGKETQHCNECERCTRARAQKKKKSPPKKNKIKKKIK